MDMPPWFATKHVERCYRQHNVLHGSFRPFDIFYMCSFTITKTGEKKNSQKSISHVTDLQVLQSINLDVLGLKYSVLKI